MARWPVAKRSYEDAGAHAEFRTYEGVGHQLTDEMMDDVARFLKENLD